MELVPPISPPRQVGFERAELTRILDLYGRMVSAGHWRDYAIDFGPQQNQIAGKNAVADHGIAFHPQEKIARTPGQ